jgi:hypothetical protein
MLTTLPPSCAVVMKSGNLNLLEPSGPLQACNRTALPLLFVMCNVQLQIVHNPYTIIRVYIPVDFENVHIFLSQDMAYLFLVPEVSPQA